jgi:hypothetical protein
MRIATGGILLAAMMLVAVMACEAPPDATGPAGEAGHSRPSPRVPEVMGRVLYSADGQVIGILFLTPQGDFFESRCGAPTGIITIGSAPQPITPLAGSRWDPPAPPGGRAEFSTADR